MPYLRRYVILLAMVAVVISSCKSRKNALRGQPGEIVKPLASIAQKYADVLGVDKRNIENGRLYSFIDEWMGTPYHFGGMDKTGVDCSGFVYMLQQQVYGVNLPRMTSQQVTVIKRKYENELQGL
jgi:probable lipoprotein NlpC